MNRIPLGVGVVFASLFALGISIFGTNPQLSDYWSVPFVFVIAWALALILIGLPETINHVMAEYVDYQYKRLLAARHAHEREQLKAPPTQPVTIRVIDMTLSEHDRRWRHWLISCAAESKRLGTIKYSTSPGKPGMKEFFGADAEKWQVYIDLLAAWGKCWPRVPGQETFFKPGITPALVFDLLVGGQMPSPLPDGDPPALTPRQQFNSSTAGNTEETAVNGEQTGSTVFATDR